MYVNVYQIEVLSNILVDAKGITKRLNTSYQLFIKTKLKLATNTIDKKTLIIIIITNIYTFECIRAGNKSITSSYLLIHLIYEQGHEHAYYNSYYLFSFVIMQYSIRVMMDETSCI